MAKKFQGQPEQFKHAIESLNLNGTWEDSGTGLKYKTKDKGVITWFHTTGTIQVQGIKEVQSRLTSLIADLDFKDMNFTTKENSSEAKEGKIKLQKKAIKIFVVHGHDTTSREQLELILHKLGLEPFVLANTGGGGLTIIEALENEIGSEGSSKFGIVLLTPDDFGYSKVDGNEKVQPRARQNVVLEMGMLISAIGRANTVILKKGHLEIPSDANGILYLPFNDHVKETVPRLVDRLRSSGFEIETHKITNAAS